MSVSIDSRVTTAASVQIVIVLVVVSSMVVATDISLAELIEDRPRSLGVDSRYLSHNLAVVCMRAVIKLGSLRLLMRTNLLRAHSFGSMTIPVLSTSLGGTASASIALLVVHDSILLEKLIEVLDSVSIASI